MNRLHRLFFAAVLATAVISTAPIHAITYGFVDTTNAFGNTGAFIVKAPSGQIFPICSGTLIAPNVFLTASHCTAVFEQDLAGRGYTAFVSFDNPIPFGDLTSKSTKLVTVTEVITNPVTTRHSPTPETSRCCWWIRGRPAGLRRRSSLPPTSSTSWRPGTG